MTFCNLGSEKKRVAHRGQRMSRVPGECCKYGNSRVVGRSGGDEKLSPKALPAYAIRHSLCAVVSHGNFPVRQILCRAPSVLHLYAYVRFEGDGGYQQCPINGVICTESTNLGVWGGPAGRPQSGSRQWPAAVCELCVWAAMLRPVCAHRRQITSQSGSSSRPPPSTDCGRRNARRRPLCHPPLLSL